MDMIPLRMLTTICIVATLIRPTHNQITSGCMHSCECHGHIVKCDCAAHPSDSVTTLTILPMSLAVAPTELVIHNCQKVDYYPWSTYSNVALKKVEIVNVAELNLRTRAFSNTSAAHSIVIRNTVIQNLLPNSFGHITGIYKIELDNVTVQVFEGEAFAEVDNVSHFRIINSQIATVKSLAFPNSFNHIGSFLIANTTFGLLDSDAFHMENVMNLTFNHLDIGKWSSGAFAPSSIVHASIRHSNISELHENAFSARNVGHLTVIHNRIDDLYPKSFGSIKNVTKFEFSDNVIHELKKGIFFGYSADAVQQEEFLRNKFRCIPAQCWFLQDEYSEFVNGTLLQTSVCSGPHPYTGKTFPEMSSLRDDEDFCDDSYGEGSGRHALDVPFIESETETMSVFTTADASAPSATTGDSYRNCANVYLILIVTYCVGVHFNY